MRRVIPLLIMFLFMCGCQGNDNQAPADAGAKPAGVTVQYEAPAPAEVPAAKTPKSDEDWEAISHNKNREVIEVLNIINPVAVYLTEGFKQYGDRITNETYHGEWKDTQAQLTMALTLYEECKKKMAEGEYSKQLFLDLEETWQLLVKTGVAGLRTKQMLDAELKKLS